MVYSHPDNDRVSKDPGDVQCSRAVWRQLVWGVMAACALVLRDWLAPEVPAMEELSCRLLRAWGSLSLSGTSPRSCK